MNEIPPTKGQCVGLDDCTRAPPNLGDEMRIDRVYRALYGRSAWKSRQNTQSLGYHDRSHSSIIIRLVSKCTRMNIISRDNSLLIIKFSHIKAFFFYSKQEHVLWKGT